jgi:hypothetical protein
VRTAVLKVLVPKHPKVAVFERQIIQEEAAVSVSGIEHLYLGHVPRVESLGLNQVRQWNNDPMPFAIAPCRTVFRNHDLRGVMLWLVERRRPVAEQVEGESSDSYRLIFNGMFGMFRSTSFAPSRGQAYRTP